MVRIVRLPRGGLAPSRSSNGRGAWLCHGSPSCLEAAIKRRGFDRAYKAKVATWEFDALPDTLQTG